MAMTSPAAAAQCSAVTPVVASVTSMAAPALARRSRKSVGESSDDVADDVAAVSPPPLENLARAVLVAALSAVKACRSACGNNSSSYSNTWVSYVAACLVVMHTQQRGGKGRGVPCLYLEQSSTIDWRAQRSEQGSCSSLVLPLDGWGERCDDKRLSRCGDSCTVCATCMEHGNDFHLVLRWMGNRSNPINQSAMKVAVACV